MRWTETQRVIPLMGIAFSAVLAAAQPAGMTNSQSAPARSTVGHLPDTELYSESNYLPDYGLLTDTRLRYHFLGLGPAKLFFGVALQRQDKRSEFQQNIYINSVSPLLGAKVSLLKQISLVAEYRQRLTNGDGAKPSEPDPRAYLAAGDFLPFRGGGFIEYYGEIVEVPRITWDPVSTAWAKVGFRQKISTHFLIDPYAEFFVRRSRSPDLGRETTDPRAGLRFTFAAKRFSASALAYYSARDRELQELLVLWGEF